MNRSIWNSKSSLVKKPWGSERRWTGLFSGKEIYIKKGNRTSLKFNKTKNEVLFLQSGELFVEFANEQHFKDHIKSPSKSCILSEGDILNVQAGCPYRLSAVKDCVLFEISDGTPTEEKVVIDDDYGRETNNDKQFIFNCSKDQHHIERLELK